MLASTARRPRSATRILHGKEGVDGSNPSEGFTKCLQSGTYCRLSRKHADTSRTHLWYARRTSTSRVAARRKCRVALAYTDGEIFPAYGKFFVA